MNNQYGDINSLPPANVPAEWTDQPQEHEQQQEVVVEEQSVEPQQAPSLQSTSSSNEKNIRALREKAERAERLERERDEYFRRLQELEARSHQVQEQPKESEFTPNPDDLVEWKHVEKKIKKLEEQLQSYHQQTAATSVEVKLAQQYPDFNSVVSKENVETLRSLYPEIATTLNASQDLYSKAASAYTLIKKLGIYEDPSISADRIKAQTNASKPRPLASVSPQRGDSPLSRANAFANGLTDDLKQQLYKEMLEARKNY